MNNRPVRILAVVVLYKVMPSESVTLSSLIASISQLRPGQAEIKILLYDNTPGGQDPGMLPHDVHYRADNENSGLATAYNYATGVALEAGFDWLLTLDQDTNLPFDFARNLCNAVRLVSSLSDVAAIAPRVSGDGRVISPGVPKGYWMATRRFPDGFIGIPAERVYAINSASTIRVSSLLAIGGYDPRFAFDFSDLDMYHRLQSKGMLVFVAGDFRV